MLKVISVIWLNNWYNKVNGYGYKHFVIVKTLWHSAKLLEMDPFKAVY